jgi:hypothetical protein
MYYIFTLDSHELLGPFMSRDKAHAYAKEFNRTSYRIDTDTVAQQIHIHRQLTLVPSQYR